MIFYELKSKDGREYSNLGNLGDLDKYLGQDTNNKRDIRRVVPEGTVRLIATDSDARLLGRNKIASIAVKIYADLISIFTKIEEEQSRQYTILAHNLVSTHSRLQDSIGSILPEGKLALAADHLDQIKIAMEAISLNPENTSSSIIDISKRIVDLQAQLEGFKMLSGNAKLDLGMHNIKQVLQNIIHPYYEDFSKNRVGIKWSIDDTVANENRIKTDYKVLNLALHHLLNNAVKYTKPHSSLRISFNSEKRELRLDMVSIRIEKGELEEVFKPGYCGKNVPEEIAGDGVGLYMVKKAIDFLGGKILIQPEYTAQIEEIAGIRYTPNSFIIQFP